MILPEMRFVVEKKTKGGVWRRVRGGWSERVRAEEYGRNYCVAGRWRVVDREETGDAKTET